MKRTSKSKSKKPSKKVAKRTYKKTIKKYGRPEFETPAYQHLVSTVKERDGNACQFPGCKRRKFGMECHHIIRWSDSMQLRYNPMNCILLCNRCHTKITGSEEIYASLFFSIVQANIQKQYNKDK